jgi:hypothetical protein
MKMRFLSVFVLFAGLLVACAAKIPATASPVAATHSPPPATVPPVPSPTLLPCIAQGSQDDINARLRNPGDAAVLCQGALIELSRPVIFTARGQQIYTEGYPADNRRAILRIVSPELATAIIMRDFDEASLR